MIIVNMCRIADRVFVKGELRLSAKRSLRSIRVIR